MTRKPYWARHLAAALLATLPAITLGFGPGGAGAAAPAGAAHPGEELFGRNCQLCHNSRGKGGKAPQLVRGAWGPGGANSDDFMFNTIKNGRPNTQMGGFGGSLSDAEIRTVIAFLRAESVQVKDADRKTAKEDYQAW
jgi:mono/diheme cytochrome c family protein